ncbi:MAG: hypothetical protein M1325_01415, partial [Actinobacteria bacterium]|nr:hypothetical protein [Actinomycetota bacterium]
SYAAKYGAYQDLPGGDRELQAPLFACYRIRKLAPGVFGEAALQFLGFADTREMARTFEVSGVSNWRTHTVPQSVFDGGTDPAYVWSPPGASYLYPGGIGWSISLLAPGGLVTRNGVRGIGQRI